MLSGILSSMKTQTTLQDVLRLLRNMIRTGVIVETDLDAGRCRVQTGGIVTPSHALELAHLSGATFAVSGVGAVRRPVG